MLLTLLLGQGSTSSGPAVDIAGATSAQASSGATLTISKPAGMAAGDYWLVLIEGDASTSTITNAVTLTPPAGWSLIQSKLATTAPDNGAAWCYARLIDGSEGATAAFAPSNAAYLAGLSVRVSGASAVHASSSATVQTSVAPVVIGAGTLTTTVAGCAVVWLAAADFTGDGAATWSAPAGYSSPATFADTTGAWCNLAIAWRTQSTAGAESASGTATLGSTVGGGMGFLVAFAPGATTVSATQSGAWSVRNAVTATQAGAWSARNTAAATNAGAWSVRVNASATQAAAWSIRTAVSAAQPGAWSVLGAVTASATQAGAWSVRNAASATAAGAWSVRASIAATKAGAWSVRASTSQTQAGAWSVRSAVSTTRSGTWSVRSAIAASVSGAWSIAAAGIATGASAGAWSVRKVAAASVGAAWSVRNVSIGAQAGSWSVLAPLVVSGSMSGAWRVWGYASAGQAGAWSVQGDAAQPNVSDESDLYRRRAVASINSLLAGPGDPVAIAIARRRLTR